MTFAENDYEACKSYLDMLPANPLLKKIKFITAL